MAQGQFMEVKLSRFDAQPWGFRLQGGVDFAAPLLVQKVNAGSLAEQAGLLPGDAVLKINEVDVFSLRHKDAQDIVVRSGNNFVITIQRGGSTWRPQVTPTGHLPQPNQQSPYLQTVTKTSLAHKPQEVHHIGSGYNNAARPFVNGADGSVKSIVNKQYNCPVGIYSDESIAETLSAQAEVLAGGVLGVNFKKNEREYQADKSEVLKFLREEETGEHSAPAFNNHQYQEPQQQQQQQQPPQQQYQQQQQQQQPPQQQHYQQQQLQQQQQQQQQHYHQQQQQQASTRHVTAPINVAKPPSTGGLPTGQNICTECERLITGVFVRIKDKNLHVECFKCATCGTSLKNQGYYNFNNKLYCDIHAKLAALQNPPSGTEGYVPVPIKPNTKLSANTISTALSAHGFNGVSNGSSAPAPTAAPVLSPPVPLPVTLVQPTPPPPPPPTAVDASCNYSNSNMSTSYGDEQSGDQPFEYVTLTGNVIRSVVPPGKGVSSNYRVNQGYARPYGATAAPKSPVASYPPQQQQQQWGPPPQQQHQQAPKNAGNAYATLPRTHVGQQELNRTNINSNTLGSATLPRKSAQVAPNANNNYAQQIGASHSPLSHENSDDATAMLTESIGKINMGDKMNDFMSEASKIISNMLEARLANNGGGAAASSLSNSNSNLSLRSNSCTNLSKSPMVVRKRLDLDDFKDLDPTEPMALKPVVAIQQQVTLATSPHAGQKAQPQVPKNASNTLNKELPSNHPMGKLLDICDNRNQSTNKPIAAQANNVTVTAAAAAQQPMPTLKHAQDSVVVSDTITPLESVVFRNAAQNRRASRGGELSIQANDRRSYIEPPQHDTKSNDIFSVSVKALGPKFDVNATMSAENEEVVSQLLKDGKRPICCQCNSEITKGPFITALGRIWCPDHFICTNANCRRPLQDIGFVEEKGDLYCEYCFEKYLAPTCSNCAGKIKGDCLNAIGKHFHPECFTCGHCGKLFGNTPFFLEEGKAYCEADWNELFTTKCFACGFPVEAGDRWVEALNHNYHSQCFNCTYCKQNLEGTSFYNKGGRPFCKNHAR